MNIFLFGTVKKISKWMLIVSEPLHKFLSGFEIIGVFNIISERLKNFPDGCAVFGTSNQAAERVIMFLNE